MQAQRNGPWWAVRSAQSMGVGRIERWTGFGMVVIFRTARGIRSAFWRFGIFAWQSFVDRCKSSDRLAVFSSPPQFRLLGRSYIEHTDQEGSESMQVRQDRRLIEPEARSNSGVS